MSQLQCNHSSVNTRLCEYPIRVNSETFTFSPFSVNEFAGASMNIALTWLLFKMAETLLQKANIIEALNVLKKYCEKKTVKLISKQNALH